MEPARRSKVMLDKQTMTFREIEFGSDDFRQECELRNEVLRVPSGLSLYDENIEEEKQQIHFGLFNACNDLLACAIAAPLSTTEVKIRQVAVRPEFQGKGIGRLLIRDTEQDLALRGFAHLVLHVRMTAVGFYTKLDYGSVDDEFVELGIPHIRMGKNIQPSKDCSVGPSVCEI